MRVETAEFESISAALDFALFPISRNSSSLFKSVSEKSELERLDIIEKLDILERTESPIPNFRFLKWFHLELFFFQKFEIYDRLNSRNKLGETKDLLRGFSKALVPVEVISVLTKFEFFLSRFLYNFDLKTLIDNQYDLETSPIRLIRSVDYEKKWF